MLTNIARRLPRPPAALALLGASGPAHAQPAGAGADAPAARAQALDIYRHIIAMDTSVEGHQVPQMAAYLAGLFRSAGFPAADIHVTPQVTPLGQTASL